MPQNNKSTFFWWQADKISAKEVYSTDKLKNGVCVMKLEKRWLTFSSTWKIPHFIVFISLMDKFYGLWTPYSLKIKKTWSQILSLAPRYEAPENCLCHWNEQRRSPTPNMYIQHLTMPKIQRWRHTIDIRHSLGKYTIYPRGIHRYFVWMTNWNFLRIS